MIAGLILAAGESSRMGQDKALLTYRGRTFLECTVATLHEAGIERIAVVLGHHAQEIQRATKLDRVEVVINPDHRRGQTSSLQVGLQALLNPQLEAVVLCLVDHPSVSSETVQTLTENFRETGAPVVMPTFGGRRGHPVLIARKLLEELMSLPASQGANKVIRRHGAATRFVGVNDAGVVADIDDPETYERLSQTQPGTEPRRHD